mmetsp:Transcript_56482/g.112283  ORF Transcript_56482/g.112283 Transcript_56482/m.112283 type:complete len:119 (+) Transcript_56482:1409-1765(+)
MGLAPEVIFQDAPPRSLRGRISGLPRFSPFATKRMAPGTNICIRTVFASCLYNLANPSPDQGRWVHRHGLKFFEELAQGVYVARLHSFKLTLTPQQSRHSSMGRCHALEQGLNYKRSS